MDIKLERGTRVEVFDERKQQWTEAMIVRRIAIVHPASNRRGYEYEVTADLATDIDRNALSGPAPNALGGIFDAHNIRLPAGKSARPTARPAIEELHAWFRKDSQTTLARLAWLRRKFNEYLDETR
ncbi:MAG TPA: hypothetical protein VHZ25_04020 [Acidobacteriaceae bacterium]|jgi:hypothetical protein|nr:hypothetical protein [Acidobacteriaceae bacterium]